MNLCLADVASCFHLPDCVGFLLGCFHHPVCSNIWLSCSHVLMISCVSLIFCWTLSSALTWSFLGIIWRTWLAHPWPSLSRLLAWWDAWPDQGYCRTLQDWCPCRRTFFWSLDRQSGLYVLLNSHSSSSWLEYFSGTVVTMCRKMIRYKVLAVMIHHPYYLVLDLSDRLWLHFTKHV